MFCRQIYEELEVEVRLLALLLFQIFRNDCTYIQNDGAQKANSHK